MELAPPSLALDHLVVAAPTLEAATSWIESALGVRPAGGGTHPGFATHNRLLRLGDCYLEALARDPASTPTRPRWFGLDDARFDPASRSLPALRTFVVRTDSLERALALLPDMRIRVVQARRGELLWKIGVPDDGALLLDGAFPTLIEWPDGDGPAKTLPENECALVALEVTHPQAAKIQHMLSGLKDPRLSFHPGAPSLRAAIRTPSGSRWISSTNPD